MVLKPTEKEEEYFARSEFERKKKIEEEKHKNLAEAEKKRLSQLHQILDFEVKLGSKLAG
jgi:hypothetical protein